MQAVLAAGPARRAGVGFAALTRCKRSWHSGHSASPTKPKGQCSASRLLTERECHRSSASAAAVQPRSATTSTQARAQHGYKKAGHVLHRGLRGAAAGGQASAGTEEAQHRHADDRRHRLERLRCISGGGAALGHPTPNVDRLAKEGAVFTSWYGQASCTAGRARSSPGAFRSARRCRSSSFPATATGLRKETPTIAEFFKKNGYGTYFSGKWHLGDKPESYPIEHGFDEMKHFAAYYPGVYAYDDTRTTLPSVVPDRTTRSSPKEYHKIVNLYEWEGVAGQPAKQRRHTSTTTIWPSSMSGRRIRRSNTSRSTPRMTSRSSWTSTS